MGRMWNIFMVFIVIIIDLWCGYLWYNLFTVKSELNQMFSVLMGVCLTLYSLLVILYNCMIFNEVIAD